MINLQYSTINEPVPDFIYDGLQKFIRNSNTYHPQPEELITKLVKKFSLDTDQILLTAGCDEGIRIFADLYGKSTSIFTPTYMDYQTYVEGANGTVELIDSIVGNDYVIDPQKRDATTLFFLANPNNPFGCTSKETIEKLITNNPQAMIVIDEVYSDFYDVSAVDLIKKHDNVAVLWSFSKAYGLAGFRIGCIMAKKNIIDQAKQRITWSNVSYPAVGAAIIALEHNAYYEDLRKEIIALRAELEQFVRSHGYYLFPSQINVILMKFETEQLAGDFVDLMKENDINVNHGNGNSNVGLDKTFVRITIGTSEEIAILKKIIAENKL